MVLLAAVPVEKERRTSRPNLGPQLQVARSEALAILPQTEPLLLDLIRSLRELHLLLRSARLYDRQHPRLLQSLDGAYESLRSVAANMNGLEIRVERSGLVVPKLNDAPLPDVRGANSM